MYMPIPFEPAVMGITERSDEVAQLTARNLPRNSLRRVIALLAQVLNAILDGRLMDRNPAIRVLSS